MQKLPWCLNKFKHECSFITVHQIVQFCVFFLHIDPYYYLSVASWKFKIISNFTYSYKILELGLQSYTCTHLDKPVSYQNSSMLIMHWFPHCLSSVVPCVQLKPHLLESNIEIVLAGLYYEQGVILPFPLLSYRVHMRTLSYYIVSWCCRINDANYFVLLYWGDQTLWSSIQAYSLYLSSCMWVKAQYSMDNTCFTGTMATIWLIMLRNHGEICFNNHWWKYQQRTMLCR